MLILCNDAEGWMPCKVNIYSTQQKQYLNYLTDKNTTLAMAQATLNDGNTYKTNADELVSHRPDGVSAQDAVTRVYNSVRDASKWEIVTLNSYVYTFSVSDALGNCGEEKPPQVDTWL